MRPVTFEISTGWNISPVHRDWIASQIEKYGQEHPLVRSMIYAEFMDVEDRLIVSPAAMRRCLEDPPIHRSGTRVAFCDFAAGGDENVLAVRDGNRVWIEAAWHETDTIQATRRFIRLFKEQGLSPSQIFGDEGGLGIVMCDALKDDGWNIHRMNNGATAEDKDNYANLGSEMWFRTARKIERREVILPDDPIFLEQIGSRRTVLRP